MDITLINRQLNRFRMPTDDDNFSKTAHVDATALPLTAPKILRNCGNQWNAEGFVYLQWNGGIPQRPGTSSGVAVGRLASTRLTRHGKQQQNRGEAAGP